MLIGIMIMTGTSAVAAAPSNGVTVDADLQVHLEHDVLQLPDYASTYTAMPAEAPGGIILQLPHYASTYTALPASEGIALHCPHMGLTT